MRNILRKIKQGILSIYSYPNEIMLRTQYDKYWESKRGNNMSNMNSFQKYRSQILISKLENNSTLLDFGSGDGNILKQVAKNKKIKITASDFSIKSISHLSDEKFEVIELDISNNNGLKELKNFDYISALEVLEHIQNPEDLLIEMIKKSKKGVFVSFPNTGYIFYRLRFLFGRFPVQWRLHPGEHLRFWTFKDLKWWLKKLGIENHQIISYEGIPFLNKIIPSLFGEAFIVWIKK
jgi:methionine biosynthesis protein MetW